MILDVRISRNSGALETMYFVANPIFNRLILYRLRQFFGLLFLGEWGVVGLSGDAESLHF